MNKRGPKVKHEEQQAIVKVIPGTLNVPSKLSTVGKKAWKELTNDLNALGLLSITDSHAIEQYCEVYSQNAEAESILKQGLTINSAYGVKPHPMVKHSLECKKLMKIWLESFGLTPISRKRLVVVKEETTEGDEWNGL